MLTGELYLVHTHYRLTLPSVVSLHTALYAHKIGDTVTLQVVRDGKSQDIKVTLS